MFSNIDSQWFQQLAQTDWAVVAMGLLLMNLGLMVIGLLCYLKTHRRHQLLDARLQRLERDLRAANNSAIGMGQQLIQMEKILKQYTVQPEIKTATAAPIATTSTTETDTTPHTISSRSDTTSTRAASQESSYNQARDYLSQGKSVEDTMKICGLSYAEVSLLQALSKQPASIS